MGIKSASDDREYYALAALLAAGLLAACGGEGGMTDPDPDPEPAVSALAFVTQPGDATAGEAIAPAVEVEIRDGAGNRVEGATDAVTIALDANPGGELKGTLTVNAADGVATFSDLVIERAASGYALEASVGSVSTGASAAFEVTAAAASRVGFVVEPSDAEGTVAVAPAVEVAIQDAFGNTVTGATDVVTVALDASPAGATLSGTIAVSPTGGVAEFDDLSLALPGDYTLEATAGGLAPATSASFAVHLTFTQLSSGGGSAHTCAVTTAHAAYCWGSNIGGQLGDGTVIDRMTPVAVTGGYAFRRVAAGERHSCGLTTDDVAYCWGQNTRGPLGDGTTTTRLTPVPVAGGYSFDRIDVGGLHTCAVTTDDTPYCWGDNEYGQLGDGTTTERTTPVPVLLFGGLSLAQVSAGYQHTCGVSTSGVTRCWGNNFHGQLGDGTTTNRTIPVAVAGGHDFERVAAGGSHTCAVTVAGVGHCWGANEGGRLGDGTTTDRTIPVTVAGGHDFEQVAAGEHSCGATADDLAYCWGPNEFGGLGDGTTTDRLTPVPVAGSHSFDRVYPFNSHTCAITTDDAAYCWGSNGVGRLGDGTTANSTIPVKVVQ